MVVISRFERIAAIPAMLIFGTATVVTGKLLFEMSAGGDKFTKPWWQVLGMFMGMMGCLGVFYGKLALTKAMKAKQSAEDVGLLGDGDTVEDHYKNLGLKGYIKIFPPAMCDLVATGLMNIGLLFIPASVWQLLRGSMVIFSAFLSIIFLHRKLYAYNWLGIGTVLAALICVGIACIEGKGNDSSSQSEMLSGIFLVVGAQVIQATQIVIEEFLLKDVKAPAVLIVGTEGFWGFTVCAFILLPILYFIPPPYGEDTIDTFDMMGENKVLIWVSIIYILAILFYNMSGMLVTQQYTAVHRTILEAMRTLCIWITDLFIYYCISKWHGEEWTSWSFLQLAGFMLLVCGTFIYNRVFEVPGFFYPEIVKASSGDEMDD